MRVNWTKTVFIRETRAYDKGGMAVAPNESALEAALTLYGKEVAAEAAKLLAEARRAGSTPGRMRVSECWDRTAMQTGEAHGLDARVELFDCLGARMPVASFLSLGLFVPEGTLPSPGTAERVALVRALSARSLAILESEVPTVAGDPQSPGLQSELYGGCAWDLSLRRWRGAPGDEPITFTDVDALEDYFSAYAPRA